MTFKEALKVIVSSEESATNRAAAFAAIIDTLFDYLLANILGIEPLED